MKYKKIIFLDIDGVLNSKSTDMRILNCRAIALLKRYAAGAIKKLRALQYKVWLNKKTSKNS